MCRTGYASYVADAIVWASGGAVEGVPTNPTPGRVVSMSFTGDADCPSYLQAAIDEAVRLRALPVAASGNDGVNTTDFFPANCQGVLAVAASTRQGGARGVQQLRAGHRARGALRRRGQPRRHPHRPGWGD